MTLSRKLVINKKIEHYIRIKTHKSILLRFWVKNDVNSLYNWTQVLLVFISVVYFRWYFLYKPNKPDMIEPQCYWSVLNIGYWLLTITSSICTGPQLFDAGCSVPFPTLVLYFISSTYSKFSHASSFWRIILHWEVKVCQVYNICIRTLKLFIGSLLVNLSTVNSSTFIYNSYFNNNCINFSFDDEVIIFERGVILNVLPYIKQKEGNRCCQARIKEKLK